MTRLSVAACVLTVVTAVTLTPPPAVAQVVRIVQTNSAGDNVHLIDPATNMIVGEITGVEVVHGVAAAPDGSRLYLSNESTETLDIVAAECFKAVCVVCPHEQCDVDFVANPGELDPSVVGEIGEVSDPVYLCPCHNSTFTMAGGERLGGPAPRGLYRFRVTGVTGTHVEIGEVEEDVLLFF